MKHTIPRSVWLPAAALALAATLAACGGGTGTAPASVNGTAATGASIAAGTVTLKCVSGTSTAATTGTDGSFTIDISGVTLPCVGRVDYKDSSGVAQKLHTFIGAAGTANITPVTDLLVANLTGGTPVDAFDKFDAAKAKSYTTALVKAAAAAVKTYLKNTLGVDTTNLPDDPVGTKLTAKSGSVAGDAFDKVLDDIQAKLKAGGKKLSDIAGDLAKSGGSGSVGAAGSAIGKGAYAATDAAANAIFLSLVKTKCTKDTALSDAEHDVYKNCNHSNTDPEASNLVYNMYQGALPRNAGGVSSGPGFGYAAKVSSATGLSGSPQDKSCKIGIAEPFIPAMATLIDAVFNTEAGSEFSLRGTAKDTLWITPGGVVLQYNMTNVAGNRLLTVQFETATGLASGTVGDYNAGIGPIWSCL